MPTTGNSGVNCTYHLTAVATGGLDDVTTGGWWGNKYSFIIQEIGSSERCCVFAGNGCLVDGVVDSMGSLLI